MTDQTQQQGLRAIVAFAIVPALSLAASGACQAAGGHHSVDDASILDAGQCQLETWFERETANARQLQHLGPACRLGALEIGLNADRVRLGAVDSSGSETSTTFGLQLKWAAALSEQLSIGAELAGRWQGRSADYQGGTVVLPLSWQLSEPLALHLNLGRDVGPDRLTGGGGRAHLGAALEWSPRESWTWVAERYREGGLNYGRLAGRWTLGPAVSLDLSRAQGLGRNGPAAWWTLGLNLVFAR